MSTTWRIERKNKIFFTNEVARKINTNINPKKAPSFDEISQRILKELPKKAIIYSLPNIYSTGNAILRTECVSEK